MPPRFSKIMSKMQDEEDVPADIPNPEMYMPEPEREIARPFPPGVAAQEAFDDMLQRRVVDPLSQAGYEDMGAGLAAIPSAAHSMIVPQTDLDVAGTIIPLPGVAKLMKKGKFRKIRNAMKAEDPEEVGEIIAKQAGKEGVPYESPDEKLNRLVKEELGDYKNWGDEVIEKAEVRAYDEKEMLQRADRKNAEEKRYLEQFGKSEKEIEDGIKEKYGIEGDNWSAVDSEADRNFGTSDLSGKRGNVIEITDGDQTLEVLEDEYLDIMGLSGGIPIDETPFAQAMKTKKPKVEAPQAKLDDRTQRIKDSLTKTPLKSVEPPKDPYEGLGKMIREDEELDAIKNQQAIDEARKKIQDRINKPKIVEPPKSPKGEPEASSRFPGIQSQMDVAPTRMDERGRSFGDVGQSEFLPDSRPMPRFEEVPRRNYVESELPGEAISDMYPPETGRHFQRAYMDKSPEELQDQTMLIQTLGGGPASDAYDLQKQMYKGRPSFEAEQEKFGKVKEAMRGNSTVRQKFRILKADGKDVTRAFGVEENMAGMTQKELQDIVDPTGKRYKVVSAVSPEESEELLMEKLRDF